MLKIKGNIYILAVAAEVFNTLIKVKDPSGKMVDEAKQITREELIKGLEKGDKDLIAFAEAQVEKGSPYFQKPSDDDLENIRILEEATKRAQDLASQVSAKDAEIEKLKKQLEASSKKKEDSKPAEGAQ